MPAKSKKSTKKASGSSPWLSSFGVENDLPDSLLEVLKDHDITCEEIVLGLSERDIADLELSVGHRVLLRRAIAALTSDEPAAASGNTTLEKDKPVPTMVPQCLRSLRLPQRKLQPEVSSCFLVNLSMARMESS